MHIQGYLTKSGETVYSNPNEGWREYNEDNTWMNSDHAMTKEWIHLFELYKGFVYEYFPLFHHSEFRKF